MNGLFPLEHALHVDILFEGDAVDIFHDDILDHIAEGYVINADDIGMIQYSDRLGLILESADKVLIAEELILHDLDRDLSCVDRIIAAINIRHTADADELAYLISSVKFFACVFIHTRSLLSRLR